MRTAATLVALTLKRLTLTGRLHWACVSQLARPPPRVVIRQHSQHRSQHYEPRSRVTFAVP
eukprot:7247455-Pyramimonas_sp.AAC.2